MLSVLHHWVWCQLWAWHSLFLCSRWVVSNSLWLHGAQHARLPCTSLPLRVCWNSCTLSQWCHLTISSSITHFSCFPLFPRKSESVTCLVVPDSLRPHGLPPTRLLCPWDSPGKSTGVGCHFLLQGIFLNSEIKLRSSALQANSSLSEPPGYPYLSQHQSFFHWVGSSHQVAKVLEFQLQHQFFQWIFRADLLQNGLVGFPCCPRDSQESSPATQFKSINSLVLCLLHGFIIHGFYYFEVDFLSGGTVIINFLENFIINACWILSKDFSAFIAMII